MATVISVADLKQKLDSGASDFVLVDTLKPESFKARHIPGARNVPNQPDFVAAFEASMQVGKDKEIIVYCSSETCSAHAKAADALEAAGYTNVVRFSGGLAAWQKSGNVFESDH